MQETLIERSLLSEFEGDLPQAIGVVVVHCVRGNATGVAAARPHRVATPIGIDS
jgi:hypothetical protein